jgi:hypothetical protein
MDSPATGLADDMAKLLVSADYSDLTLRCSNVAELPVHRNVVCRRSTVLAAACRGRFAVRIHEQLSYRLFFPSPVFSLFNTPFLDYFRAQTAYLLAAFFNRAR